MQKDLIRRERKKDTQGLEPGAFVCKQEELQEEKADGDTLHKEGAGSFLGLPESLNLELGKAG